MVTITSVLLAGAVIVVTAFLIENIKKPSRHVFEACGLDKYEINEIRKLVRKIRKLDDDPALHKDLQAVSLMLTQAEEYGLEAEVVTWAIRSQAENPELSTADACTHGLCEWIK